VCCQRTPSIATSINNLASTHINLGNFSRAHALYEGALRIWASTLPPSHPNIRLVQENVAACTTSALEKPAALAATGQARLKKAQAALADQSVADAATADAELMGEEEEKRDAGTGSAGGKQTKSKHKKKNKKKS
jgi:hypothetical protein